MEYGSNILTGGTPSADNVAVGYEATKAVDGNTATPYGNASGTFPHWWKYDLGVGVTKKVRKLRIFPYNDGAGTYYKNFTLSGSNDDSTYTDIYSSFVTNDNPQSWQDFTFSNNVEYRYYKVTSTTTWRGDDPAGDPDYSYVSEFEMMELLSSPSPSLSLSLSPSITPSLSESLSPSLSSSLSPSITTSLSPSLSPSLSISPSLSSSLSPSITQSLSPSASPSMGYNITTRGDELSVPTNDNDLETAYTEDDELLIAKRDFIYVGQTGTLQNMIHQFKSFVGSATFCTVEWEGKSTLAPSESPVYLQIYNQVTNLWETIDTESEATHDINFELSAKIPVLADYINNQIISCRVWQYATE